MPESGADRERKKEREGESERTLHGRGENKFLAARATLAIKTP